MLYFELVLIRWLGSEIEVIAYFKNFPLIGAFIGLGLGMLAYSNRDRIAPGFFWLLAGICAFLSLAEFLPINELLLPPAGIEIWADPTVAARYTELISPLARAVGLPAATASWVVELLFLPLVFLAIVPVTLLFRHLGAFLGATMNATRPLPAYAANLMGSIAGIAAFTLLSYLQTPPLAWILVGLLAALPFAPRGTGRAVPVAIAAVATFLPTLQANVAWSPYYRLSHSPMATYPDSGHQVAVNHRYHQFAIDLSDPAIARYPDLASLRAQYELPFLLGPRREQVAVAGAGTGNDVAAALRLGAGRVAAVEIDPAILALGERLHGEHPYARSNVERINTDARAWLRQDTQRYDVISFGLLDSHTLLSAMSSVRLESYLYTVEGIRDAYGRLAPDGVAAMSFAIVGRDWLAQRLYTTIDEAIGKPPVVVTTPQLAVLTYVFGPSVDPAQVQVQAQRSGFDVITRRYASTPARPATDDWPFLYLNPSQMPTIYLLALAAVLAFTWLAVRRQLQTRSVSAHHLQMFFLGAGFLLVETKSITELSLLFGSTWVVNAAVFGAILVMALLATIGEPLGAPQQHPGLHLPAGRAGRRFRPTGQARSTRWASSSGQSLAAWFPRSRLLSVASCSRLHFARRNARAPRWAGIWPARCSAERWRRPRCGSASSG